MTFVNRGEEPLSCLLRRRVLSCTLCIERAWEPDED